ncbi:aldehyde dehydrogenase family 16 member A1 isoform X2 [Hoplias malabaricus]
MEYGASSPSSAATARAWLEQKSSSLGLFIDGNFVCPEKRETLTVTDSTGGAVCSIICAEDEDISSCASSASGGFKAWSELSGHSRAKVLLRLASTLQRYTQCVSELCEVCQSPCSPAVLIRLAQYCSGWAQLRDTLLPEWAPRGVGAVVVSDDCFFYSIWIKVFPALAMGNAVVVVPGVKLAPAALLLAQLGVEAGLPAGALNVVIGDGTVGVRVAQNKHISFLTYSGKQQDGEVLAKQMAGWGLPVSLSLSLSAVCPFIIFESADIDSAVDGVIEAAFKKKKDWQWVLCVQESVLDSVVSRLKLRMTGMKCVPLVSESERGEVDAVVKEALQQGATLVQSCSPPASGSMFPPTVLCGLAPASSAAVTPPPGPLLPLLTFRSAAEGAALANRTPHGQAASIWTEDLTLALETAKSVSAGSIWVNSHSVTDPSLTQCGRRDSGNCTDGGREGLYQFLRPSLSPSLPRSTPSSLEYSTFGSGASTFMIPEACSVSSVSRSCSQFVGGKQCKADSGCSRAVQAPGGAVLAYCPDGGRKDVRNAVEAALKVHPGWLKKSPAARALSLFSLSDSLEKKKRDMAASIQAQTGLSVEEAEKEVELSISRLSDWAARCDKLRGEMPLLPQTGCALSASEPVGIVAVVLPDAKPLLSLVSLLGAAISTGNAVILVPSEKYPLPALDFIQVLQASDLPAGLVSVITGGKNQLTQALANHSEIQAIWYWGSKEGCQFLQYTCCSPLKRLWLHCEEEEDGDVGRYWSLSSPSLQEEMWREAVVWKSVWIPTA